MTKTHNLKLDYLAPAQAQKHVTVNEALRRLDILVQPKALSKTAQPPAGTPAEGDSYIINSPAIGDWAARENEIAAWADGAWLFSKPQPGWTCFVMDQARSYVFGGAEWTLAGLQKDELHHIPNLGVNASADNTNRLSVKSQAILFDHDGSSAQVKINKNLAADTAALLFQSGYIGAAEMGLTGDKDLRVKVSSDGAAWKDALRIDASDGVAAFPQTKAVIEGEEPQLVLRSQKTGDNDQGDEYGQIVFYSDDPDHARLPGTQGRIVMTHTRAGTGHSFADAGMVFETLAKTGLPQRAMVLDSRLNNVTIGDSLSPNCKLVVEGQIKLETSTLATLPDPNGREGAIAYVSDETGGATLAFCDGTHWRRVSDRAIVS